MMRQVTDREAQVLCGAPDVDSVQRFLKTVTGHNRELVGPTKLALLYIDRWLHRVSNRLDVVQRWQFCKEMWEEGRIVGHICGEIENRDPEDRIPGFFISLYDEQWAGWSGGPGLMSLQTFEWAHELPEPHLYAFVLGVTPLYFRLERELERMDASSNQNAGKERQAADDCQQ